MTEGYRVLRSTTSLGGLLVAMALLAGGAARMSDDTQPAAGATGKSGRSAPRTMTSNGKVFEMLTGRVVWLDEAFKRRYGTVSEARAEQTMVVLETNDGQLVPIVPDPRGIAFVLDERLRDQEYEMLVRRYPDAPHVQVVRMFRRVPEGLLEVDYWCDICSIDMYYLQECECCHGPIRLREELFLGDPLKQGRK